MTEQEAIRDIVENGINLGAGDFVDVEALKVAIKALEKQIAKKPLIEYHCGLEKRCPTCNCEVSDIEHRGWACKCGQKLDWE